MNITDFLRVAPECGCVTAGKVVRGMCVTHYDRWIHATPRDQRPPAPRAVRDFWRSVDKSGDCWLWQGPVNRKGYGVWSEPGYRGLSHRFALLRSEVPSSPDLLACHRCDNPPCVNPEHLYWGTAGENSNDYATRQGVHNKGKFKSHCPKGHLLSGDNLRVMGEKKRRRCRICDNARARKYQQQKREMARGIA